MMLEHRIITNGERFRVETRRGKGKWETEMVQYCFMGAAYAASTALSFPTYHKAQKWIRKTYGERANLRKREWRPA